MIRLLFHHLCASPMSTDADLASATEHEINDSQLQQVLPSPVVAVLILQIGTYSKIKKRRGVVPTCPWCGANIQGHIGTGVSTHSTEYCSLIF
ncbi:hypothetical protein AVEN_5129-1 [Araneus ventricosus]|uniref:Uncharacterized protein n=1 Tax=Araneus ventricosus TaxID=182803 RepID=A0A4Y2P9A0_ARAVE|nr:hypothetical protein AVEN_5129-1 [Araneus ventricosus]